MSDDKKLVVQEMHNDISTLIHITEGALQKAIAAIPPEYGLLSEKALEGAIQPTELDYLLRSSFSRELERVRINGGTIKAVDIYGEFCARSWFYEKVIASGKRLAWLTRPMPRYEKMMEATLFLCNKRLWEIVNLPLRINGKISPTLVNIMLNAIKMVKENVKGMPVQVSESKILAVNVDQRTQSANVLDMNMDQLNRNIKKLESKLEKMEDQHRGDAEPVIDVESEESTIDPSKY